jgi:hypothetical protein
MTWEELQAHLALADARIDSDTVVVLQADPPIKIERGSAFEGEPWLIATAPIAPEDELQRPHDALKMNDYFAVGALAIVESELVFRWASPVAVLEPATLDRYLAFVTREAQRLRSIHRNLKSSETALFHFAE